eukprot:scaffold86374_cov19-Tisochrysis_lutea.AAC.1
MLFFSQWVSASSLRLCVFHDPWYYPAELKRHVQNVADNITHPTDCPGPPCYIPATREKFWGESIGQHLALN